MTGGGAARAETAPGGGASLSGDAPSGGEGRPRDGTSGRRPKSGVLARRHSATERRGRPNAVRRWASR